MLRAKEVTWQFASSLGTLSDGGHSSSSGVSENLIFPTSRSVAALSRLNSSGSNDCDGHLL